MKAIPAVVLTLALCAAAPSAFAEGKSAGDSKKTKSQPTTQRAQTISGTLTDAIAVQLKGQQERHVLAKIRNEQGKFVIVDLGTINELRRQQVKLRRGDELTIAGRPGRINERPIFVADRFQNDADQPRMMVITVRPTDRGTQRDQDRMRDDQDQMRDRQDRMRDQGTGRAQDRMTGRQGAGMQQQGLTMAAGTIADLREMSLKGQQQKHVLARIETRTGQTFLADLGTRQDLQDARIAKGDRIAVLGQMGRINDRPVLIAYRVADIVTIDRGQQQRGRQTDRQTQRERGDQEIEY